MMKMHRFRNLLGAVTAACAGLSALPAHAAWEPTAPVEIVVPAGTGGGADQMARFIRQLVAKHGLMKQPLAVVNKSGNSGIEGLNDFKPAKDLLDALRAGAPSSTKLGGTGSKQEDQLISVLLETAASTRIAYVPLKGGGDVAKALAAREVDMTVNNPIEAAKLWGEGKVRPLCVFDGAKLEHHAKIAGNQSWNDLPTCMSFGIPVQYLMMRGIFMAPGGTPDQVAYYVQLLDRVRALPEWKDFMAQGALEPSNLTGAPFVAWLDRTESFHRVLMREAKLTYAASTPAVVPGKSTTVKN